MIEETTFSNTQIKSELYKRYDLKVNNIEIINNGTANIYKIMSNNEKFILKEFQSKYSQDDVLKEINAIEYLKENSKIPLPIYLKNNNNEFYFKHKGRVVVIQNYIDGKAFQKNEGSYEQLLESAYYLGQIIKGFEKYKVNDCINITDWYSQNEFDKANKKYNDILDRLDNSEISYRIKMDIIFKKQLLDELSKNENLKEIINITHKVSHGDYSSLQFIYNNENKIKAILDFIKVKKLPIVWEIARSYSYLDKEARDGNINVNNIVEYTKEVAKVTNLNEYDFKYLPYVYLIQLARSTFGYSEYFKENIKNKEELLEFAFYRTNICRDLYIKANEISNKLLEVKGSIKK